MGVVGGAIKGIHTPFQGTNTSQAAPFFGQDRHLGGFLPQHRQDGGLSGQVGFGDQIAGEAFGPRNGDLVQWVARTLLDQLGDPQERYSAGDVVQFPTPDGAGQYAGAVVQVGADGAVQFDFNHPLAGQAVVFEVQLIGVL